MDSREKDREQRRKMKTKIGEPGETEELQDYFDVKKKKKRKKAEYEEEENDHTHTSRRRRKVSKSESEEPVWDTTTTELTKMPLSNTIKETEQEISFVIHKVKKKKKIKSEEAPEDDTVIEISTPREKKKKKKKKKKKRETEEEEEMNHSSVDYSSSSPVAEKRDRERREKDNVMQSPIEHTFLKPLPPPIRKIKGTKRDKRLDHYREEYRNTDTEYTDSDTERGKKTYHYTDWTTRRRSEEADSEADSYVDQRVPLGRIKSEATEETYEEEENKLPNMSPCSAHSNASGWETDTSVDDLDYSDDMYHGHQPVHTTSRRMCRMPVTGEIVLYREGEDIEGFVPDPRYSSDNESNDWVPVDVPRGERHSPGFIVKRREIPTLEEVLYNFPEGVGVPPEEIEEVHEGENYWIIKEKTLSPSSFVQEAKEYIEDRIHHLEDYFDRLLSGHLKPSEMKETIPRNFDDPYYPTPRQLEFLNTLNIRVDWPLEELHSYHLTTCTIPHKTRTDWQALRLFADTSRFSLREDKIIVRNWFAFQKEYGFYDLRPLVSVRTARVGREDSKVVVQRFEYLSHHNKLHFLLYLGKDLPTRTLVQIHKRIIKLVPLVRDRCFIRNGPHMTGLVLAKLLYVMEVFGADMSAAELLIGHRTKSYYYRCFVTHIMLRNVKLRVGPWRPEEDARMLRGLQEVMYIRTFEDAYWLRRVPWTSIFPYVRTRSVSYMRRRLIVLVSGNSKKEDLRTMRANMTRFIRLLYTQQVDDLSGIDLEGLAKEIGAANPIRVVWSFRKLYYNYIPYHHRITVPEGLRYLFTHIVPLYEKLNANRTPQIRDPDSQEEPHPTTNPSDPSNTHDPTRSNPNTHTNEDTHPSNPRDDPDDPRSYRMTDDTDDNIRSKGMRVDHRDSQQDENVIDKENDITKSRRPRGNRLDRVTQKDHIEGDPSGLVSSHQCSPGENQIHYDLSESDEDMISDSDDSEFEDMTLGQAVGKNDGYHWKDR